MSYINRISELLYSSGCIKFGEFILSSGMRSPVYLDLRALLSYPKKFKEIIHYSAQKISNLSFNLICGIESSGIPLATGLSLKMDIPMIYVRKETKKHGLEKIVEGEFQMGKRVLVVDDVATSGRSILHAVKVLESVGLIVKDAFVIVDRGQGSKDLLLSKHVKLHCLASLSEIIKILGKMDLIKKEEYNAVLNYLGEFSC